MFSSRCLNNKIIKCIIKKQFAFDYYGDDLEMHGIINFEWLVKRFMKY